MVVQSPHLVLNLPSVETATSSTTQHMGTVVQSTRTILNLPSTTSNFINNSAHGYGGAIDTQNTTLTFSGTSNFINNSAHGYGGAIDTENTKLIFSGTSNFINNSADQSGGAIFTYDNTVFIVKGASVFINNSAGGYGGAICTSYTILTFSGTKNFIKNSANYSGAIYTENTVLNVSGTNSFINNSANHSAGAIGIHNNFTAYWKGGVTVGSTALAFEGTSDFINNSAGGDGGAIVLYNTIIHFKGTNNFIKNSAKNGGAIFTNNTVLKLSGTNSFIKNSATNAGAIFTNNTVLNLSGTNSFIKNSATNAGAIFTNNTVLNLSGTNSFIKNSAEDAGAIVTNNTVLNLSGTNSFIKNSARDSSGAMFTLNTSIIFNGTNSFISNTASIDCGAMFANHTVSSFIRTNNFLNNSAGSKGGAIYTENTVLTFTGANNFINNSVGGYGGAIFTSYTILTFTGTNNFIKNSANDSGVIFTSNTILNLSGTNSFINNSARQSAGAIGVIEDTALPLIGNTSNSANWNCGGSTVLTFEGTNDFISNSAGGIGGAIVLYNTTVHFNGTNNFSKNSAKSGGAIITNNTVVNLCGTNSFIKNSAHEGAGAIFTLNTLLIFNGTNSFISNTASTVGMNNFLNTSAGSKGGAIYTENTVLTFTGANNFIRNSVGRSGGAISANYTALTFSGNNNFITNSADFGGAIHTYTNNALNISGTSSFINNSASVGGAICAIMNSSLTLNGTIHFTNNGHYWGEVSYGGAVYIGVKSTVYILPNTTVHWENNCARIGGAICAEDSSPLSYCYQIAPYVPKQNCFFQLPGQNFSRDTNVKLVFKNNYAGVAGSVLYGGAIDNCKLTHGLDSHSSGEVFDMIVHNNDSDYNTISNISSDPIEICHCENNLPNCSQRYVTRTVYPGETFQVSAVTVGQRNGTVSSEVMSNIDQSVNPGHLQDSQYLQETKTTCTQLNYTIFSLSQFVRMGLYTVFSPCSWYRDYTLHISVKLHQICPPGFNISKSTQSCVCDPKLQRYTNSCTITNGLGRITRDEGQQFWVGYDNQSDELILHPQCPFDYCVNDTVVFPLNNTDSQCANNRSGLLCGRCRESYSLVLGSSRCEKCTKNHLVFLIPFAVMGVALVFLLLACKLTVGTGMLSGLVFYANIVGVNRTIFLPVKFTDAFSIFIAWLNLDFSIETCFYDGMDVYSKTWLQFVFPVYILALVGLMILVSHFSRRFAKLLGNNPVSILATLILLSYTKILRTLITVFYITYLQYPTYNRMVWLYDANIGYLSGKHIPLFLVAVLVFLFLFLPYTLLLLFGQWLQAISHLRLFSWVNSARLKPFMDSYHAPYKAKHCYWPGLLLILCFVLLLVFAFKSEEDPSINLLAILVANGFLVAWAWISGGVYRNWCLDALECSFALNLITLVGATSYVNHSHGNQLAVGYTSISVAFATFVCIVAIQLANVTGITQYLNRKCPVLKNAIQNPQEAESELISPTDSLPDRLINPEEYEPLSHTPQEHVIAEPTEGANEMQGRLITPVYTYSSVS